MLRFVELFVFCVVVLGVSGHSYHAGRCRNMEPMSEFDMSKFLGLWYAIEKTKTSLSCLTYNFTVASEAGKYQVEQVGQSALLRRLPMSDNMANVYVGKITSTDTPGVMRVKFPLNFIGSSSYIVFAADYNSYAGIYTCQNLGLFHRRSVTLLSRGKKMGYKDLRRLHHTMEWHDVDVDDLSIIDQFNCPNSTTETINFGVNENALNGATFDSRFGGRHTSDRESVEDTETGNFDGDAEWIRL